MVGVQEFRSSKAFVVGVQEFRSSKEEKDEYKGLQITPNKNYYSGFYLLTHGSRKTLGEEEYFHHCNLTDLSM
jgi:hypothetical protein